MSDIILIRHGETDWNRAQRFQGHIDVPLNAIGLEQARRLAERMAAEPVNVLVHSDLTRTRQTAAPTALRLGLQPLELSGLREQSFGVLEGMSGEEIRIKYPDLWNAWIRHDPDFTLPRGESVRSFHRRVVDTILELARAHAGQPLAVVTHGGVLDMVYRTASGMSLHGPRSCQIPNAGLNRIRVSGNTIDIVEWADDAHVRGLGIEAAIPPYVPPEASARGDAASVASP